MIVKFEIRMIPKEKIRMSRQLSSTPRQNQEEQLKLCVLSSLTFHYVCSISRVDSEKSCRVQSSACSYLCIVYVESKQVCIYSQKVVLVTHVVCTWIGFVQKCIVKHYFYSILQFVLKFTISILFEKCKNLSKVIETLLSTTTLIFKKDSNCLQEKQFLFILCTYIILEGLSLFF